MTGAGFARISRVAMRFTRDNLLLYAPILLGVALVTTIFLVAEAGHGRLNDNTVIFSGAQTRQVQLTRFLHLLHQSESSQRGFLLTENPRYLDRFDPANAQIAVLLDEISRSYEVAGMEVENHTFTEVRQLTAVRLGELRSALRLFGEEGLEPALALVNTDVGEKTMMDIRGLIAGLQELEARRIQSAAADWRRDLLTSRLLLAAACILSLALIVLVGAMFARDAQRRERSVQELAEQNRELDAIARRRTELLFNLSSHLQNVTEKEKAKLARELHDELGGLLVATKIDVSWLRRVADDGTEASALRWDRVLRSLEEGLDLKRRVIESLRPTLLDNVGLVSALRWLVDEGIRRSGIVCEEDYPEALPDLSPDASIAVFRVVQECLTNIMKHSQAQTVRLTIRSDENILSVTIRDNGVGIDEQRIGIPQSHGLLGMRHRIESLGGKLVIGSLGAGMGTEVSFTLPWARAGLAAIQVA